ncbi:YbaB/EbfC family DNA-binding protein, partial [Pediococcus acidilactici]|nr:YbaB/EbfC family DNA-binding protein [Pediococcus acidilactici]
DPDMLQDLVVAAVNDAMSKIDSETNKTMGKYTKGIPGL